MVRIVWGVAVFGLLCGLYLFLAGSVDAVEASAMLVCAAVGTTLAVALEVVAKRHYVPLPPPRAVLKPIAALLPELVAVGRELVATILSGTSGQRGSLVEQPFSPGDDTPRDAARRAIAIVGVSLAPRTFVVRGERTETMLLHALPRKDASSDTLWPA